MNDKSASRLLSCFIAVMTVFTHGCQYEYDYEIQGTVRDYSANGALLPEVNIVLKFRNSDDTANMAITNEQGAFRLPFRVDGAEFGGVSSKWSLILSKPGYNDEIIDIKPSEEPKGSDVTRIIVVAFVRAAS